MASEQWRVARTPLTSFLPLLSLSFQLRLYLSLLTSEMLGCNVMFAGRG